MKKEGTLTGFLDEGCSIKGDIVFHDFLRIHGRVSGSVASDDELLVGEGGVVEGEITVGRLVVAGTVKGTVKVRDRLVVHGSGKLLAEVYAPRLVVDEGGIVEGAVHMAEVSAGKAPARARPREASDAPPGPS